MITCSFIDITWCHHPLPSHYTCHIVSAAGHWVGMFSPSMDPELTLVIQMFGRCGVFALLLSKLVSEHARRSCSETILETTLQKHCIHQTSELPRSNPETGCGLPSTGQKARLIIGKTCWFWNSIGQISAAAVRPLYWSLELWREFVPWWHKCMKRSYFLNCNKKFCVCLHL